MLDGVCTAGVINSLKNERIRRYRRLRKRNFRYKDGKFLVEGVQAVAEALTYAMKPECLIMNDRGMAAMEGYAHLIGARSIPCFIVDDKVMNALTATTTPQGVIAVAPLVDVDLSTLLATRPPTILVANRVRDPGNLGNMVRIGDAAGAGGMVVCRESVDLYNPKTVRSTAGSIFHIPVVVGPSIGEVIQEAKRTGYTVFATQARQGTNVWEAEWPARAMLIMGNEAWGMPEVEEAMVDGIIRVPIIGKAESLNVSAAAAVLLYEIERSRGLERARRGGRVDER